MDIVEIINDPETVLIDVREAAELETDGKVPGAIHIPLGEIPQKAEEIREMEAPVVLFCRSGNRSGRAIAFLSAEGIDNLYNGGGFQDVLAVKK